MASELRINLRTLNLSAKQLKQMTNISGAEWSDSLINDYLTIFDNFVDISGATDSVIDQVEINTFNIQTNTDNIQTNTDNIQINVVNIQTNADGIANNASDISDNATNLSNHIISNTQHGVTGVNVGTLDFCTASVGGVVLLMDLVADAISSTATIVLADIGAAPLAYDQTYTQSVTDLLNDTKAKHNQLVIDLNASIIQLNDLIAKSIIALQMSAV